MSFVKSFSICAVMVALAGCSHPSYSVVFWPGGAVKRSPADLAVDAPQQLVALRRVDPERDAQTAFRSGDLRLVADRPGLARFQGVPDDALVNSLSGLNGRYGFKVIASDEDLLHNEEFLRLKAAYEERYNQTMYRLVVEHNKQK
jgi:hypothetical protein